MAATTCRCSSVVFVGNIPYHVSEEELRSACEEIGPVVSLRVAADKDTGRRRGYGFCEYLDDETALSACRNLDGCSLSGRALRVRLADRSGHGDVGEDQPVGVEDATHAATMVSSPGVLPRCAVTAYLAGMSRRQLLEMLNAVDAADEAALVEVARRECGGFATLIEQARVLLDMAAAGNDGKRGGAWKRQGDSLEALGKEVTKLRKRRS